MNNFLSRRLSAHPGRLTFGLSFLFFAFVMACAPYASDDLEFGSLPFSFFSQYLTYALEYGNGRLLGNLTAIFLSKFRILCVLGKALALSSLVVLIPGILGQKNASACLLSFLLISGADAAVFGEAYVWTSGFANYIPPIWCALVVLYAIMHYPRLTSLPAKIGVVVLAAVLGFSGQLFIEHSSGVNVLLALCTCIWAWKCQRKALAPALVWLLTAAAGLSFMLLIPRLFYITDNHTDSYRSAHIGSLAAMVLSCARNAIQLSNHYFGACTLPVCFGTVSTVWLTRKSRSEKANRMLYWLSGCCSAYAALSLVLGLEIYLGKAAIVQHALSGLCVLLAFAAWVAAAWKLEGALRRKLLLCLGFALVSLLPLLVVTPIPNRVIFQSYVFVVMGALLCFRELEAFFPEALHRRLTKALTAAALLLILLLGSVFTSVAIMVNIRDQHIRREMESGATQIQVFSLPYRYTTWDHLWSLRFLYPSEQEVQFQQMDFDNWMNDVYQ